MPVAASMSKPAAPSRSDYSHVMPIPTRWMDNDIYGHVNNVVYYSYFDTVINRYLIDEGGLDHQNGTIVGMAVETSCRFHRSLAFPDLVHAGLRVGKLGRSSVRYEIGIFRNDEISACADGHFVHVFVERGDQRPVSIPEPIRAALQLLVAD